ncbi:hypothetical protein C8R46DRAFT_1319421 [Mycena filopes]|nr:hypothetical protein C8R46DRAFT_1319421 [Mycena filopes]
MYMASINSAPNPLNYFYTSFNSPTLNSESCFGGSNMAARGPRKTLDSLLNLSTANPQPAPRPPARKDATTYYNQLRDLPDVVLTFTEHEACEQTLPFTVLQDLLETHTIASCAFQTAAIWNETEFAALESRAAEIFMAIQSPSLNFSGRTKKTRSAAQDLISGTSGFTSRDNIVATSGMRACTAVVTEVAYHKKKTIDAEVSFLWETEWKQELEILLGDLVEEDGTLKRSADLKSDASVAWQKVQAAYPTLSQERLVTMTADQIIAKDPKIARILGATKKIFARDSKTFTAEIAKYIDSKEKKLSKHRKKDKKKKNVDGDDKQGDKDKKKGNDKKKNKTKNDAGPAL